MGSVEREITAMQDLINRLVATVKEFREERKCIDALLDRAILTLRDELGVADVVAQNTFPRGEGGGETPFHKIQTIFLLIGMVGFYLNALDEE